MVEQGLMGRGMGGFWGLVMLRYVTCMLVTQLRYFSRFSNLVLTFILLCVYYTSVKNSEVKSNCPSPFTHEFFPFTILVTTDTIVIHVSHLFSNYPTCPMLWTLLLLFPFLLSCILIDFFLLFFSFSFLHWRGGFAFY